MRDAVEGFEKVVVERALAEEKNNVKRAAERLGVSRVTLYRLLEKHQLNPRSN